MAIRIRTISATDLRPASTITKRAFGTAITVAGTSGKVVGYWQAVFVRLPATGFTNNSGYPLFGHDGGNGGFFNGGNDHTLVIGGDNASQGAARLRPLVYARSGTNNAYSAATRTFTAVSALTANGNDVYLVAYGVQNTGTDAAPVWRGWAARVLVGGAVSSEVEAAALGAAYISNGSGVLLSQIFNSRPATGSNRSPVNMAIENFAHVNGDFPWDTANNRPHHDALLALAAGSGAPGTLHSYASLIAAQNAGTLGYANLRSGARADLSFWWPMTDLTAGSLANAGSGGSNALSPANWNSLTDGLEAVSTFTPAHWTPNPTIAEPAVKFHGGRGTLPFTIGGTYQSAFVTGMQRRWTLAGNPISGLDWAAVGSFSGGAWSITDTLPMGGPYTLEVRATNNNSFAAAMTDFLVGTVMLTHGQSGMAGVHENANAPKNVLGITLSAGVQGLYLEASNNNAGGASYVKPAPLATRMIGGQAPSGLTQGTLLLMNEWQVHNPGHPLLIANMAIGGTAMADWASNATIGQWTYLGTVGEPGVANAGGVGRVGHYAWMLRGIADVHVIMWTPNMSSVQATRTAYADAIDARFTNSPNAPWLVLPPWRGHRSPPDGSSTVGKRGEHVSFVAERGARGILGPYWPDIVMDGNPQPATSGDQGSLHCAFHSNATAGGGSSPVSDQNQIGQARLGRGMGRSLAWVYDRTIKAHGPRVLAAWFRDAAVRTVIEVELGRVVRTLNGVSINNQFWISADGGSTFAKTGFTVALDASGTRAVLTSTGGAWPATNVRVDYARAWPFGPADGDLDETLTERKLDGLLYDDQVHRGGVNLATPAGNPLASANGSGVAVTARGTAKLFATERWTGARNVTVQMIAADGVTVLREKTLAITAS